MKLELGMSLSLQRVSNVFAHLVKLPVEHFPETPSGRHRLAPPMVTAP